MLLPLTWMSYWPIADAYTRARVTGLLEIAGNCLRASVQSSLESLPVVTRRIQFAPDQPMSVKPVSNDAFGAQSDATPSLSHVRTVQVGLAVGQRRPAVGHVGLARGRDL